jgi:hypothetical protein
VYYIWVISDYMKSYEMHKFIYEISCILHYLNPDAMLYIQATIFSYLFKMFSHCSIFMCMLSIVQHFQTGAYFTDSQLFNDLLRS